MIFLNMMAQHKYCYYRNSIIIYWLLLIIIIIYTKFQFVSCGMKPAAVPTCPSNTERNLRFPILPGLQEIYWTEVMQITIIIIICICIYILYYTMRAIDFI